MSIRIVPYSVEEFSKIPSLWISGREFHSKRGEEFVLSTLRLILVEHKTHDTFGIQLLHNHFQLKEGEKLVERNNHATGWELEGMDKLMGGQVVPTAWRILKGQGLMPYEFEFKSFSKDEGINLTDIQYQSFLKDFISAVEAGGFDGCVGLAARGETPGGLEITQGKSNIFFPTGTFDAKDSEQITAGWYFNSRSAALTDFSSRGDAHIPAPMEMSFDTSDMGPSALRTLWGLHRASEDSKVTKHIRPCHLITRPENAASTVVTGNCCGNIGSGSAHGGKTAGSAEEGVTKRICLELCRHHDAGIDGVIQRLCLGYDGAPASEAGATNVESEAAPDDSILRSTCCGLHENQPGEAKGNTHQADWQNGSVNGIVLTPGGSTCQAIKQTQVANSAWQTETRWCAINNHNANEDKEQATVSRYCIKHNAPHEKVAMAGYESLKAYEDSVQLQEADRVTPSTLRVRGLAFRLFGESKLAYTTELLSLKRT